jgi:hypothetical protein
VADVLAGASRVIVLRGEAGMGKSALLGYLADRVAGWQVARAVGVESEMELAYAGLHQLCASMLDHLDRLPVPQGDALATVFGMSVGPAPDPFLVGLATPTLFAEVAEEQLLVRIVDDAEWLDQASAQILGFVARRLLAERVALICAARTGLGTTSSPDCLSCPSAGWATAMPGRCCWSTCMGRWMRRSVTSSSPRVTATPWPCWNCRGPGTLPRWLAGSRCSPASRW